MKKEGQTTWKKQEPAVKDDTTPIGGDARELVRADCSVCGREFLTYQYFRTNLEEKNHQEKCSKCQK